VITIRLEIGKKKSIKRTLTLTLTLRYLMSVCVCVSVCVTIDLFTNIFGTTPHIILKFCNLIVKAIAEI